MINDSVFKDFFSTVYSDKIGTDNAVFN